MKNIKKFIVNLKKHIIVDPAITAADLRKEWESLQDKGADLTDLLSRCICKVAKQLDIDPAEVQKESDDYVSEVWIDLYGRFSDLAKLTDKLRDRAAKGNTTITLTSPICQSAKAVLMRDVRERGNQWDADSLDEMLDSGYAGPIPADDVFNDFFFTRLGAHDVLSNCTELQRKIYERTKDDFSAEEIADETGLSTDKVYRERRKIYKKLRKDLL